MKSIVYRLHIAPCKLSGMLFYCRTWQKQKVEPGCQVLKIACAALVDHESYQLWYGSLVVLLALQASITVRKEHRQLYMGNIWEKALSSAVHSLSGKR